VRLGTQMLAIVARGRAPFVFLGGRDYRDWTMIGKSRLAKPKTLQFCQDQKTALKRFDV
jgi:hypothetical protein